MKLLGFGNGCPTTASKGTVVLGSDQLEESSCQNTSQLNTFDRVTSADTWRVSLTLEQW